MAIEIWVKRGLGDGAVRQQANTWTDVQLSTGLESNSSGSVHDIIL